MKKTEIIMIRNAKPDYTVFEDSQRPLTEAGKSDAMAIFEKLSHVKVDAIYSSPSKRVCETLQPFSDKHDKCVVVDEGLSERKIGDWLEDYGHFAKRQWRNFDFRLPQGESLRMVQDRSIKSLQSILEKHVGRNVVVGTHGMALSVIINHYDPAFGENEFWNLLDKMPYAVRMEFEGGEFKRYEIIQL